MFAPTPCFVNVSSLLDMVSMITAVDFLADASLSTICHVRGIGVRAPIALASTRERGVIYEELPDFSCDSYK